MGTYSLLLSAPSIEDHKSIWRVCAGSDWKPFRSNHLHVNPHDVVPQLSLAPNMFTFGT
jgi:hypothetical protein